jgi:hypothetical protein
LNAGFVIIRCDTGLAAIATLWHVKWVAVPLASVIPSARVEMIRVDAGPSVETITDPKPQRKRT